MRRRSLLAWAIATCLSTASLVGCGSDGAVAVTPNPAATEIRMALSGVAKSGQIDSGIVIVKDQIEKLKTDDAAKAAAIAPLYEELTKAKSPAEAKRLATQILEQL